MNGWQLSFTERFDYSRFNEIVLPLKLSSDKANQILLTAKVGFLDRLRLALTDYEQLLYLGAYDET